MGMIASCEYVIYTGKDPGAEALDTDKERLTQAFHHLKIENSGL